MGEDFYEPDATSSRGISPGNPVSHIQAAVTYRYGVPLDDQAWEVVTRGQTTVVVTPYLRPNLPVSIDTSTLREKTENGWAPFDMAEQLESLRLSISGELEERAKNPHRVALAREASRRAIGEIVEKWLLAEDPQWKPGAFSAVKVYFLNEVDHGLSTELGARR